MSVEISIEDYVPAEKAPHEYRPLVEQLIAAGPDKVASAVFDNEAEAKTFILEMQKAARELNVSAVKRVFEDAGKGKIKAGVSIRAKITRTVKPKADAE